MIQDQRLVWNKKHTLGDHEKYRNDVNLFAKMVLPELKKGSSLLDLGCGIGKDDNYFASNGVTITATDFSDVVIADDIAKYQLPNLAFVVSDLSEPLPHSANSFNAVYAHLSLHYFSDDKTREIFAEIARVLKPSGRLFFACKSIHDHLYGEGEEVAQDTFVRKGHIRHFFSLDYCKDLLAKDYVVDRLEEISQDYDGDPSTFIYCFATKK
jgi:ubiquinone/menaquinone biosynthesis C-methylase UbiE